MYNRMVIPKRKNFAWEKIDISSAAAESDVDIIANLPFPGISLGDPRFVARIINADLFTLGIRPYSIKYDTYADEVLVTFKTIKDLNLYKLIGKQVSSKWSPDISYTVKDDSKASILR